MTKPVSLLERAIAFVVVQCASDRGVDCTTAREPTCLPPCPAAVKAAGGQVLEGGSGVRVGGWTITSHKGPITGAPPPPLPPSAGLSPAACLALPAALL